MQCFSIKNAEVLAEIPHLVTDEGLRLAYEEADRHGWSKEEFLAYDDQYIAAEDARGVVDKAIMESQIASMRTLLGLSKLSTLEIAHSFNVSEVFALQVQYEMEAA